MLGSPAILEFLGALRLGRGGSEDPWLCVAEFPQVSYSRLHPAGGSTAIESAYLFIFSGQSDSYPLGPRITGCGTNGGQYALPCVMQLAYMQRGLRLDQTAFTAAANGGDAIVDVQFVKDVLDMVANRGRTKA